MQNFQEWFDDYQKIAVLPWERKGKTRFGNELQATTTGGKILISPFQQHKTGFNTPITELPTPQAQEPKKAGLGDLGMKEISKTTFKSLPIPAGESPTISHGFPV